MPPAAKILPIAIPSCRVQPRPPNRDREQLSLQLLQINFKCIEPYHEFIVKPL